MNTIVNTNQKNNHENLIVKNRNRKRKNKKFEDYKSRDDRSFSSIKIRRCSEVSRKNSSRFQENNKVEQSKIMDEQKLIDEFAKILL